MSAPGTSNKKDNAAPQKVGRPTNNMWALKTPQGRKMGSSLAVIQSRQAPWWPGDVGGQKKEPSGVWSEVSPVIPGHALRLGKPGVSLPGAPNVTVIPGQKTISLTLEMRDAKEILSGQRKNTVGITSYSDLGPQVPKLQTKTLLEAPPPPVQRMLRYERTGKKMKGLSEMLELKRDPGFFNQVVNNLEPPVWARLQGKCGVRVGLGFTDARALDPSTSQVLGQIQEVLAQEIKKGHTQPSAKLTLILENRFCPAVQEAAATILAKAWVPLPHRGDGQSRRLVDEASSQRFRTSSADIGGGVLFGGRPTTASAVLERPATATGSTARVGDDPGKKAGEKAKANHLPHWNTGEHGVFADGYLVATHSNSKEHTNSPVRANSASSRASQASTRKVLSSGKGAARDETKSNEQRRHEHMPVTSPEKSRTHAGLSPPGDELKSHEQGRHELRSHERMPVTRLRPATAPAAHLKGHMRGAFFSSMGSPLAHVDFSVKHSEHSPLQVARAKAPKWSECGMANH